MMAKLSNATLRTQLTFTVGILLTIFVIFALISFSTLEKLKVNGPTYERIVQGKDLVADILPPPEYIVESYLVAFQMLGNYDSKTLDQLIERSRVLKQDYLTRHDFWQQNLEAGNIKSTLVDKSYGPAMEFYDLLEKKLIPAVKSGNLDLARRTAFGEMQQAYENHRTAIDAVVQMTNARNSQDEKEAATTISNRTLVMILVSLAGVAITVFLSFFLSAGISRKIKNVVSKLVEGTEQVGSASQQVASASQSLAEGASEQAASLQETGSSLEEMASMTRQNADNTRQANILAADASVAVTKGVAAMGDMSKAIQEIKKSSDETAKIIKVIDEIAFQTNLLALNAAVEAARAGEAGKGFAVVAEEVRNLAQRSAEAAKNTNVLIEDSQKNAENGVRVTQEYVLILNEITTGIKKVKDLVSDVTLASEEQSRGISRINTAVSEMDQVTQQNASGAEECSSASEELAAQAQQMQGAVAQLSIIVGGNDKATHEYPLGEGSRNSRVS
jgi:hypothetical protein